MALETAQFLNSLNSSWPEGLDEASTADDHLRLIKACLQRSFTNVNAAVTATPTELNYTVGVTSNVQTQLDTLDSGKLDISGKAADSLLADVAAEAQAAQAASALRTELDGLETNKLDTTGKAADSATADYATNAGTATTTTGNAATATLAATATNALNYTGGELTIAQIPLLPGTKTDAATGGARGTVELATTAEALAGTDSTRAVTPASLGSTLSKANPGYYVLPGGLTVQWGAATFSTETTTQTAVADSFPRTFTTVYKVIIGQSSTDAVGSEYTCNVSLDEDTITTSGFSAWFKKDQAAGSFLANWIAVGIS